MRKTWFSIFFFVVTFTALAQVTQQQTTGLPAPILSGNGVPSGFITCNSNSANLMFLDTSTTVTPAGNGRAWICGSINGVWLWMNQALPLAIANTGTITGGTFIAQTCTANTVVAMTGAVVGVNTATVGAIFATAPTGLNLGLFNLTANVTAAGQVTVQGCATGILGTLPNFVARVFLY